MIDIPKLAPNHKRQWRKCRVCGAVSFYDYVPYAPDIAAAVPSCGHRFGEQEDIKLADAMVLLHPASDDPYSPTSYIESNVLLALQSEDYAAVNAHLALLGEREQAELSNLFVWTGLYINTYIRQTTGKEAPV